MKEDNGSFYRDQSWRLLMEKIEGLEKGQISMQDDINSIKEKMSWVFGLATGVTIIVNVVWQWILNQMKHS